MVETETNGAKLELQNSVDSGVHMDDMEKPFITPCKASTVAKTTVANDKCYHATVIAANITVALRKSNQTTRQSLHKNQKSKGVSTQAIGSKKRRGLKYMVDNF